MRRRAHQDDEPEDLNDPLESDQDPPDMVDVIDCPNCHQAISEFAERCPRCGNYIVRDSPPSSPTRRLVAGTLIIVILLGMAIALMR
jgi:uncharacterized paraquat-inducible protein A